MREAFKEYAQPTSLADQQENDIALAKMDIAFHYLIRKTIIEFINLCLEWESITTVDYLDWLYDVSVSNIFINAKLKKYSNTYGEISDNFTENIEEI